MANGKQIRLARLFHRVSGRSILVPMDHGASMGPLEGLTRLTSAIRMLYAGSGVVQGLVLQRGALRHVDAALSPGELPPRILHVSGGTSLDPAGTTKCLVAEVEDALALGADAVSVHVNLGVDGEGAMLRDFGATASLCDRWGMPLLAMMYVRPKGATSLRVQDLKIAARVAAETGADLVKISYPGGPEGMREIVEGCFVPVLVAGGERSQDPANLLEAARGAMEGGAAGLCIGRNTFQAPSPSRNRDARLNGEPTMKIGILGASGVVGRSLVPLLRAEGHFARAIVRDAGRAPEADQTWIADILRPESLRPAFEGMDAVINLATSIPSGKGRGDWAVNDRIRMDGTRHVVEAIGDLGRPCRLIQQGVAMLHRGATPTDETGEMAGEGVLASAMVMEEVVRASGLDWVVVRGAALHGPGTARDAEFFDRLATGALVAPEQADRWISFVHVDDLASAFALAVALPGKQAYIACDERPLTYRSLCDAARKVPKAENRIKAAAMSTLPSFRVRATRLREAGWRPAHADVLEAVEASVRRHALSGGGSPREVPC